MPNTVFMDHLDPAERDWLSIMYEAEADDIMIESMMDAIVSKHDAMIKQADAKIMTESGTLDDLEMLYQEAEEETQQAKKGVLKTICGAIKSFFTNIWNWIQKNILKRDIDPNGESEIDKNALEKANIISKSWNAVTGMIDGIKTKSFDKVKANAPGVAKVALAAASVAGAATGAVVLVKKKNSELKQLGDSISKKANQVMQAFKDSTVGMWLDEQLEKLKDSVIGGYISRGLSKVKEMGSTIMEVAKKIFNAIGGKVAEGAEAVKNTVKDGVQEIKNKNQHSKFDKIVDDLKKKGNKHITKLQNDSSEEGQKKYREKQSQWQSLMQELDAARGTNDQSKVNAMKGKINVFLKESVETSDEFALMVMETSKVLTGDPVDTQFMETVFDTDMIPSNLYLEFVDEGDFVTNVLGVSSMDTLDLFDEEAVEADKKDILDALEVL